MKFWEKFGLGVVLIMLVRVDSFDWVTYLVYILGALLFLFGDSIPSSKG